MDTDDLYGLPLDQFVAERGALARSLRTDGRRDEAAEVAALRKPSVAAWAVNQLIRTRERDVAELFEAGDALLGAHRDLLSGRGDGRALRAATEREREAVDALVDVARGLLTSGGHELSATIIERVTDTLHAVALDEDARESASGGRLVRELRHVGLGVAPSPGTVPTRPAKKRRAADGKASRAAGARAAGATEAEAARAAPARPDADAKAEAARAAEARTARAAEVKTARAADADARRRAQRAARSLQLAEERRERAANALHDAEEALLTARAEAEAAADAHRRAHDDLGSLLDSGG
jgi:hypothetical protein